MNYEIILYVYDVNVRRLHKKNPSLDFFELYENITPFKKDKKEELKRKLLEFGYIIHEEINGMISLKLENDNHQSVLLTNRTLRFSTTGDIFEMSKTVSKFVDDKFLAIYNPQTASWVVENKININ